VVRLGPGLLADGRSTHDGRVANGTTGLGAVLLVERVPGGNAHILPDLRWQALKIKSTSRLITK